MTRAARPLVGVLAVTGLLGLTACTAAGAGTAGDGPSVHRTASPVHPPTTVAAPSHGPSGHGLSAVGAVFPAGLDQPHSCTGTVVDSAAGDVVMTAAHCVSGDGRGLSFVPGYDTGSTPFGVWQVTGAYAPDGWVSGTESDDDVAFLTVAPHGTTSVQQVTGGVALGNEPTNGDLVSITGYDIGLSDQPLHCATKVHDVEDRPTIDCAGFAGGTSGSAWIETESGTPTAVGIIGGFHQGGCLDQVSYSPPFTDAEAALLTRVGGGGVPTQSLPTPPDDGC